MGERNAKTDWDTVQKHHVTVLSDEIHCDLSSVEKITKNAHAIKNENVKNADCKKPAFVFCRKTLKMSTKY